ncbi:response regulator transcription factor [Emticicia sp. SJ17W-69]|uniref:response regulator transcription factor n=1 Tax=Emticicia sp. SJ17W-69 TaxID=3421657 RepID=UPI003EB9637D
MEKKRILIIEDDQRITENLTKGLQEKGFDTEVAYDGQIGLRLALSGRFDLILLDVNLPVMNGYEVCGKIREKDSQIPIIMLTALGETDDKITGFEKGADDYIVKPFEYRELIARVNVFLKRAYAENENNANLLRIADLEINLESKMASRQGKTIDLTPKEFSLLEYLIRNKGKVISKAEIAEKIWEGNNAENSLNVIEVYINFLRKKIDKDFEPKLIHTKTGMGYVLKDE